MTEQERKDMIAGSRMYNEMRREKLDASKVQVMEVRFAVEPITCCLCGLEDRPDLADEGMGWWQVGDELVCPCCIADSSTEPVEIARRVGRRRAHRTRARLAAKGKHAVQAMAQ